MTAHTEIKPAIERCISCAGAILKGVAGYGGKICRCTYPVIAAKSLNTTTIPTAEYAKLKEDAELYKRQRDELGAHTVRVYEAIDNLLNNAEECDFNDAMAQVAPIEYWQELDEALNENNPKEAIDQAKESA